MQDIGEKANIDMNRKKVIYTEAPNTVSQAIKEGEIIVDFLPQNGELVRKEETIVKKRMAQKDEVLCDVF